MTTGAGTTVTGAFDTFDRQGGWVSSGRLVSGQGGVARCAR
ncbi:hypothetical protein [Wenjunlia vitaminophila]|nr:hypothetical protein [Wenjunlia vitaminophila]